METNKNTYARIVDTIENISRIDFSIYNNYDIIKYSAIQDPNGITIAETSNNGLPIQGGAIDIRLGITESKLRCGTCGEFALNCPGHFGHIKFVDPVFHMGFLLFLKNILSCICIRCNKLLVYKNEEEISKLLKNKHGKQRFAEIRAICKGITHCQKSNYGCGTPAHKITIDKNHGNVFLLAEAIKKPETDVSGNIKKGTPQILTPQLCYDILKSVSDEDCIIMGFDPNKSRPEDMIIVNFPVPPVQVRPSIKTEFLSYSNGDDDLTHKLVDIIKNNENLKNKKGDGSLIKSSIVNEDFMLLQIHVATFFANDTVGLPRSLQKNKKPTKSVSERLKGKEGRVRGNLMGKRVDLSARTVISSDPNIALNEVGIPLIIAKNLTYPEIVSNYNIDYLQQLVKNGKRVYPGANFVIKQNIDNNGNEARHIYHLKYGDKPVIIKLGDIVERHLIDGDIVLFNRQPSLHKLSMMGHKCHIINNPNLLTFRVNVSVTDPYNADFDGDEMNIHIPQSIQTVSELILIANAAKRFVNPATSNMAFNAKQDTLMGSYVQTLDATQVDWKDCMNILMTTTIGINNNIPKHTMIAGKLLYSEIISPLINIIKKKENGDYLMRIYNGLITNGVFRKSEIATILQKTWFQYGSQITQNFLDNLQHMILQFLMIHGFTVGIKDTIASKEVHNAVYEIVETKRKEALGFITEYENDPYIMTQHAFETSIQKTLQNDVQNEVQKIIMNNFDKNCGLYMAITSGSSGTEMNAGQIIGAIGQVIVEQKRIQKRFNNRTLPTYHQHDDSAFARGFCHNSFISGLNPMEFFFHVMSGREGVINTAITTADTGYIQRKLIKMLEDIKVEYDGTVRNANDKMIQCVYGDNGINTENQILQKITLIASNNETIRKNYIYTKEELKEYKNYTSEINEKLYNKLIFLRNKIRGIQRYINTSSVELKESYMMPVDINQFIINIVNKIKRKNKIIVDPIYVLKKIKEMYSGSDSHIMKYPKGSIIKKKDENTIILLLKVYLFDTLSPKKCTNLHKFSKEEFDKIIEYFRKTIMLAKVEGGEMVGFVGAQSIGEPVTQTNLKSFQKSGTGKTVSGGLIRVKELLGISKNIKTPYTKILLEDKYKNDKVMVHKIASYLKYTTLRDVVDIVDIYYDPNPYNKNSIMIKDDVNNIFETGKNKLGCTSEIENLPWILRIVLSKEKMIERNITMLEIKTNFCLNWISRNEDKNKKENKKIIEKISQVAIITNYDNSPIPIVHIRFDSNNYNFNTFVQFQDIVINSYRIKGIPNITESNYISEESYIDYDEEGNVLNKKQYTIMTDGINMQDLSLINGINLNDTSINDIYTIYETYGVEAARSLYIKEFELAIGSSGGYSNHQHIAILADAVTHMGGLIPVNRHGANKLDTDPFSRASFEKTVEQLLAASVFGESDHIRSVSSRIMVGSLINGGTGAFDLLLDHLKIKHTLFTQESKEPTLKRKMNTLTDLIKRKKD